jgi:uncharacterized membrane protein
LSARTSAAHAGSNVRCSRGRSGEIGVRIPGLGHLLFAVSFAVLGALSIGAHDFALTWQPVPQGLAFREGFAYASGAILLVSGTGMLVPGAARPSALVLTGFLCLWVLVLQLARIATHLMVEAYWSGLCENLVLAAGGWTIFSMLDGRRGAPFANLRGNVELGQIMFAAALPLIGLSHIIYANETASIIPSWLPGHLALAYATGVAHIAAGAAILLRILPRLTAML